MSGGRTERSGRGPQLKLEHPKIQPWVVEGKKMGEKRDKTGKKRGFWLILVISKRLRQRRFRNSWAEVGPKQLHLYITD